jgi:ABC-type transport system substrate-binding protein
VSGTHPGQLLHGLPEPPDLRPALRRQAGAAGLLHGHRPQGHHQGRLSGTREPAFSAIAETDFDTSKPVDLWFNAGAGHDEWVQAVGNSLRDNLGITYRLQGGLMFADYLPKPDAKQMTSNPEFDALIAKGNQAPNNEDATEAYRQAEDVLLEEMPMAPMFFGQVQAVHSERVSNVVVDAFGTIQLADVCGARVVERWCTH